MHLGRLKGTISRNIVISGICFLFVCISIIPVLSVASYSSSSSSLVNGSLRISEGDVPTWYLGDEWVYTIDPLYYSGPNGSFSGTIQNLKQKVVGLADDAYEIEITGDISGELSMSVFSGDLSGDITGASHIRMSDLAEETTELHSVGTITVLYIPFPYEMNLVTSSSPSLEIYDFPLHIGEQWQLVSFSTVSGSFIVQGLYDQSFDESQSIDETVQCTQKEQISVPAGSYECYTIARSNTTTWYSTEVGAMVKTTIDQSDESSTLQLTTTLQSFIRTAQPLTISEDITPAVALPGDSVIISGQALITETSEPVQDGIISIAIPSTGDTWSTTTDSDGYYSKTIVAPAIYDDTPCDRETGSGGVIVQCSSGSLSGYRVQTLTTLRNTPPDTPLIVGETKGKVGVAYTYTIVTQDPEMDDVMYYIDWGDLTNSSWVGPYHSGENITLSHTFTTKGTYTIQVKARDSHLAESGWGTLQVSMPTLLTISLSLKFLHHFPFLFSLLHHLLGQ